MGRDEYLKNVAALKAQAFSKDEAPLAAAVAELGLPASKKLGEHDSVRRLERVAKFFAPLFEQAVEHAAPGAAAEELVAESRERLESICAVLKDAADFLAEVKTEGVSKEDLIEALLAIEPLALIPYIDAEAVHGQTEEWVTACRQLRFITKGLMALVELTVWKTLEKLVTQVTELQPIWGVVLDREDDAEADSEMAEEDAEESAGTSGDDASDADASDVAEGDSDDQKMAVDRENADDGTTEDEGYDVSIDAGSSSEEDEALPVKRGSSSDGSAKKQKKEETIEMSDDEVVEVPNMSSLVDFLTIAPEEEALIKAKRAKLEQLKKLSATEVSDEQVSDDFGRKQRAAKFLETVLTKFEGSLKAKKVSVADQIEALRAIGYGGLEVFSVIGNYLDVVDTGATDVIAKCTNTWVPKLKNLISVTNRICAKLVETLKGASPRPKHVTDVAVELYAICQQHAATFYSVRSKVVDSETGWLNLLAAMTWVGELFEWALTNKMKVADAAKILFTRQGLQVSKGDSNSPEFTIWTTTLGSEVAMVHPPKIACRYCPSRTRQSDTCLHVATAREALILKTILSNVSPRRKSPVPLLKAAKKSGIALSHLLVGECLATSVKNKMLYRAILHVVA